MGMFTLMKNQANVIKVAMNEENQRYAFLNVYTLVYLWIVSSAC